MIEKTADVDSGFQKNENEKEKEEEQDEGGKKLKEDHLSVEILRSL